MKVYLILMSTLIFSLSAFADTEAGWFPPGCKECERMQKHGNQRITDTNTNFTPTMAKKKKAPPASTQGVSN